MGDSCSKEAQTRRSSSSASEARSQNPFSNSPKSPPPSVPQAVSPLMNKYNQTSMLRDNKARLLFFAYQGMISEVVNCLEEGFPINQELNVEGWTLLHLAAQAGDIPMLEMLLNTGAKLDIQEKEYLWTPLMVAVLNGQLEAVYILVQRGASLSARDRDGETARTLAKKYNQRRISTILAELYLRK